MRRIGASLVAGLLAVVACREAPPFGIEIDGDGDAGAVADASRETGSDPSTDAGADAPADAGDPLTDFGDDAGLDASATCGAATVTSCALCDGKHVMCAKGGQSVCVTDCAECDPTTLPCVHCAQNLWVARCVTPNAKGVLQCSGAARCPCDTGATECPAIFGASQSCVAVGAKMKCFTCGEGKSAGVSCSDDGAATAGTCDMSTSPPSCH